MVPITWKVSVGEETRLLHVDSTQCRTWEGLLSLIAERFGQNFEAFVKGRNGDENLSLVGMDQEGKPIKITNSSNLVDAFLKFSSIELSACPRLQLQLGTGPSMNTEVGTKGPTLSMLVYRILSSPSAQARLAQIAHESALATEPQDGFNFPPRCYKTTQQNTYSASVEQDGDDPQIIQCIVGPVFEAVIGAICGGTLEADHQPWSAWSLVGNHGKETPAPVGTPVCIGSDEPTNQTAVTPSHSWGFRQNRRQSSRYQPYEYERGFSHCDGRNRHRWVRGCWG